MYQGSKTEGVGLALISTLFDLQQSFAFLISGSICGTINILGTARRAEVRAPEYPTKLDMLKKLKPLTCLLAHDTFYYCVALK